jgi:hypothetical protein
MSVTKAHILSEIKRTAAQNGGVPLGNSRFEADTGIKNPDWLGVYWARWGDALREAGFAPNQLQGAFDKQYLLQKLAELALELGHIPAKGDLKLKRRRDDDFPSWNTFDRFGPKAELIAHLATFCRLNSGYEAVVGWCDQRSQASGSRADDAMPEPDIGYVYLLKHGSRREYKIGRTKNALRREGEIAIELPEKVQPVHVIKTDDPAGIESYWHRRFEDKRKNGEWFELNATDIAAFKRRKYM